jgi:hypothetical protein
MLDAGIAADPPIASLGLWESSVEFDDDAQVVLQYDMIDEILSVAWSCTLALAWMYSMLCKCCTIKIVVTAAKVDRCPQQCLDVCCSFCIFYCRGVE